MSPPKRRPVFSTALCRSRTALEPLAARSARPGTPARQPGVSVSLVPSRRPAQPTARARLLLRSGPNRSAAVVAVCPAAALRSLSIGIRVRVQEEARDHAGGKLEARVEDDGAVPEVPNERAEGGPEEPEQDAHGAGANLAEAVGVDEEGGLSWPTGTSSTPSPSCTLSSVSERIVLLRLGCTP